jgi:hypothetical protein
MDDFSNAAQRPQVCRIAGFHWTLKEQPGQTFPLSLGQQRCSARRRLHAQSPLSFLSV